MSTFVTLERLQPGQCSLVAIVTCQEEYIAYGM
jgi:hypothetical protein